MYEVFSYITGETIGFTDSLWEAWIMTGRGTGLDYIDADNECSCTYSDNHCMKGVWK